MQPWDTVPVSLAHGILDDETYDWWEVVKAMRESDGEMVVADEAAIEQALDLVRAHTGIRASATGSAGLAGFLAGRSPGAATAAILSGAERSATS
jgi:threonine synthase